MTETKRPRGRPRPQETIDRDAKVYALLQKHGQMTRNQISDELKLAHSVTYLSLDRLRRQGRVRTCADTSGAATLWSSKVDQPCP